MSRQVRGEPPKMVAQTSVIFTLSPEVLHKLVDVTCDDCGAKDVTFDKRLPAGWEAHLRWVGWPQYVDLCPDCSAKPEPPIDGTAWA